MDRTHEELYARSLMAARARPSERRTENWKRCGQMKTPMIFSTRKTGAATA